MEFRYIVLVLFFITAGLSSYAQVRPASAPGSNYTASTTITVKIPLIANIILSENRTRQIPDMSAGTDIPATENQMLKSIESNGKWAIDVVNTDEEFNKVENRQASSTKPSRTLIYITSQP